MHIKSEIYKKIMDSQNTCPPETGGILGGQNEIITVEHFDRGMQADRMCSYIPNIKELNDVIKQWQMKTISFMGIYHTHFWSVETLSEADKRYIDKILENMPLEFKRLYFPIVVMPDKKMVCYIAEQMQGKMVITKEKLIVD